MTRRRILVIGIVVAVVAVAVGVAYVGFGQVIYDKLTKVDAKCGGRFQDNTPTGFQAEASNGTTVDTSPYLMRSFQTVNFTSRGDPGITINAWWVPGASPDAPAVIAVHGLGSCKRSPDVLLPAGMLNKHGFAVLLIDLRNEGDSTVDTGRYAGGVKEYADVLGAFDWLRQVQHLPDRKIGVLGMSLGAATATIATGQEPGIAALWEDSGFADINVAIADELTRNGYPSWLAPGAVLAGRLNGVDITSLSPLDAVGRLNGRPIAIVHGTDDTRLPVKHAYRLQQEVQAHGEQPAMWIVDGAEHTQAVFLHPAEYETRLVEFFTKALGTPNAVAFLEAAA